MIDPFFALVPFTPDDLRDITVAAARSGRTREDFIAMAAIDVALAMVERRKDQPASADEFMPAI